MVEQTRHISWWQRIKESFKGILTGLVLIGVSIFLLFWNENHSIKTKRSLIEASKVLIETPDKPINPKNDEKVVYVKGFANTNEKLYDDLLDVTVNAINLDRQVEMYQWQEEQHTTTQSNMGGSQTQTTDYSYQKTWSRELINSSNFNDPHNHSNPKEMRVLPKNQYAKDVKLGDFRLPHELIIQMEDSQPIILGDTELIKIRKELREPAFIDKDMIYLGKNPETPEIGDIKISLSAIYPQKVSVIAVQIGTTFEPYIAKAGEEVMLLETGYISPKVMIENAIQKNKILTYWIRLVSLILMVIGFSLLFKPFVVIGDVFPMLGTLLGYGNGLFSILIGVSFWCILFSISWIAVRPLLALNILATFIAFFVFLYKMKKRSNKVNKD